VREITDDGHHSLLNHHAALSLKSFRQLKIYHISPT
jgi:hypothetical protein